MILSQSLMKNMVVDLSDATLLELIEAGDALQSAIEKRQAAEEKTAIRQIQELAKMYHLDIQDVLQGTTKTKRKPVKPKYQHPDNPQLIWTGMGRVPGWVSQLIQSGVDRETLRIPD